MNKNYKKGISFFLLSILISISNDILQKILTESLNIFEVTLFRNGIATISLIPIIIIKGINQIRTQHILIQILRGFLLFMAISLWVLGLKYSELPIATIMSGTVPFFTLILAYIFLSEKIIWFRWLATIIGFCAVLIIFNPLENNFSLMSLIFLLSSFCFACLDIINKKFVIKETMICMLFYSGLFTTLFALYPAIYFWSWPTLYDLILLTILGVSANVMLLCLLKAFSYVDIGATAPYRYLEFIISSFFGWIIFGYYLDLNIIIAALIIIPATSIVLYYEK